MKFAVLALIAAVSAAEPKLKPSATKCPKGAADCKGETACAHLSFDGIALPKPCDDTCAAIAKEWAKVQGADWDAIVKAVLPKGEGSETAETWLAGMKIYTAASQKLASCEPKAQCGGDGKDYFAAGATPVQGGHVKGFKVICAAAAGDAKATDEKACDALATDDAKKACKEWAGKKCADEKEEADKKKCESAKASAKALAASAIAVAALAALM